LKEFNHPFFGFIHGVLVADLDQNDFSSIENVNDRTLLQIMFRHSRRFDAWAVVANPTARFVAGTVLHSINGLFEGDL
jgi:hypothetical protein